MGILYNLYDNGSLALQGVTRRDIESYLGEKLPTGITQYVKDKNKYKGRYLITYHDKVNEDPFVREWNEVVKPFRNVIWVKEGGKRLVV